MQNFGQINETFKDVLANGIVERNNEHKKIFKAYTKELKENSVLRTQFQVFNKLENKIADGNVEKSRIFVNECIRILQTLDRNAVVESNQQLVLYLKHKGFELTEDYENKALHDHIQNLAFTEKNAKNIDSIVESKIFVNAHSKTITEAKGEVEVFANQFLGPAMVEKFNDKYMEKLSETEQKTFKVIQYGSEEEKEELYKGTVIECIDLINNKLNEECTIQEKDKYLQVKDKLLRFEYKPENFVPEMSKIAYLKDTLK